MRTSDSFMNKRLGGLVFLVVTATLNGTVWLGCSSSAYDRFAGTVPSFTLDKETYSLGDTITLTFELHGESDVRFYENIENTLRVWLSFRVPYLGEQTVVTEDGIRSEQLEPRDPGKINTYELEKGKPLVLSFRGYVYETEGMDSFVIVFPGFNKKFTVQKDEYAQALALEIHGYLKPVNPHPLDSLEDYIKPIRLSIRI